jgi:hypothetical protein
MNHTPRDFEVQSPGRTETQQRFSREGSLSGDRDMDDTDEFENAPLMCHDGGFSGAKLSGDASETDEFDKAPLLSHETGFSPGAQSC